MKPHVKIAYVIAAHKNPQQLSRLIDRLNGSHADFYIHVDKKVLLKIFKDAIKFIEPEKVHFLKQYNAPWSEFGIIKAEILALKTIINANKEYDFVILLSGQDYPIKSNAFIIEFFQKNKNKSFVDYFPMPFEQWPNGGMDRINRYHFKFLGKGFAHPPYSKPKSFIEKIQNKAFNQVFSPRTLPLGMDPFGGEHWWNFNIATARYIIQFLESHPEYLHFHKYSFCADEMFFQTLLLNCQDKNIYENIINDDLRYYDWSEGKNSPKTFTVDDLETLLQSQKLFARKFDIKIDKNVLDELDKVIIA